MRTYAIGDIHGALDKLEAAHRLIAADRAVTGDAVAPVVHIGDLVDRGPDSRGVIDYLMRGIAGGAPWIALKGNHDRMFERFLGDPDSHDPGLRESLHWIDPRLGGGTTLASHYGNRVNIDTGAGYGRPLTAVVIEGDQVWHLTGDGRAPILPPG